MGMTVLEMPTIVSGYTWEPSTGCDDPQPRYTLASGDDGGGFFIVPGSQDALAGQALLVLDALMNPEQKPSDVAGVCRHCGRFVYVENDEGLLVDDAGRDRHPEPADEDDEWVEDHEIDPDADPATGLRRCDNGCGQWVRYDGAGAWIDSTDGDGCDPAPRLAERLREWGKPVPDRHRASVPDLPNPGWTPDLPVVQVKDFDGADYTQLYLSVRPITTDLSARIEDAIRATREATEDYQWADLHRALAPLGLIPLDPHYTAAETF